jgi:hypothetical protein
MAEEQTLTIDESQPESGQFSDEEMDSLKVGESMQEAQDNRLAGKYENAQELEKAYIELEKKLGEKTEAPEKQEEPEAKSEDKTEDKPNDKAKESTNVLEKLWDEREEGFKDDTLKELAEANPGELAKAYLKYRNDSQPKGLSDKDVNDLKGTIGGDAEYSNLIDWAEKNMTANEQAMYDSVISKGDRVACYFAIQYAHSRYRDAVGEDGRLLAGKPPSASGDVYKSQAELVSAMGDPRYDRDPAYRRDVQEKLERSDLKF